jgi:hypothetical protein
MFKPKSGLMLAIFFLELGTDLIKYRVIIGGFSLRPTTIFPSEHHLSNTINERPSTRPNLYEPISGLVLAIAWEILAS